MNDVWQKFKGLKTWMKVVIVIVALSIIGSVYNVITCNSSNTSKSTDTVNTAEVSSKSEISNQESAESSIDSKTKTETVSSSIEKTEISIEQAPHRIGKEFVGVSIKSFEKDGIFVSFTDHIRNDITNRWRIATIAHNINISEYALDYYKTYFKSDNEVHFIVNFTTKTTTRINVSTGIASVTVLEYVDNEEKDAKELGGGKVLQQYNVYLDNGDIERLDVEESSEESSAIKRVSSKHILELKEYSFIVNTDSKKFHTYECQAAKKISAENRQTITVSAYSELEAIEQMQSKGYELCGICGQ